MFILGVVSLICVIIGVVSAIFWLTTVSDGTGNETGHIASMLVMYGSLPFFLLGVVLSCLHTLLSLV
jgi:hypothetical protein